VLARKGPEGPRDQAQTPLTTFLGRRRRFTGDYDKEIDMDSAVFYTSRNGNTRAVAETIANVLGARGTVQLLTVGQTLRPVGSLDLLVIGAPPRNTA
jgi:hypothetical protein